MIPLVRNELQQVGAGIWPPPRAKAEQRLKVNQGGEEGRLTNRTDHNLSAQFCTDRSVLLLNHPSPPATHTHPLPPLHIVVLACLGE